MLSLIVYNNPEDSIKAGERIRRSGGKGEKQVINGSQTQVTLKWDKYISENENKSNLLQFRGNHWIKSVPQKLEDNQQFLVAGALSDSSKTILIESQRQVEVSSLRCSHEEEDTRIVFHAAAAKNAGYERLIVHTPDTDVLILLTHFANDIGGEILVKLVRGPVCYPFILYLNVWDPNYAKCCQLFMPLLAVIPPVVL